jgi:hypothetical protein
MLKDISHALKKDDEYFEEISKNIWLMDNHKWAYYVWESNRELFGDIKAPIVHVDYHWDSGDDFYNSVEKESEFKCLDLSEIKSVVSEGSWIRYDSFICPAIIRGISDEVHFLCFQEDYCDEGIYEESLKKYNARQYIYRSSGELKNLSFDKAYIFDFCIDVFNRSNMYYEGDIWSLDEINKFLEDIRHLIVGARIITVSMSFEYSGTVEDTARLTKYVLQLFCDWRRTLES